MKKGLFLGLALVLVLGGCGQTDNNKSAETLPPEEAKTKVKDFIEKNLLQGTTTAQISNITEEKGLYKLKVEAGGQSIDSYMTKDGKKFFPQAMNMENPQAQNSAPQNNAAPQGQQGQQQAQQMSPKQRAEAMVPQVEQLLEQGGDSMTEQERQDLEQKLQELKDLNSQEDPGEEELNNKMNEIQKASQPIIEQMMEEQQQGNTAPQQQPQPQE